MNLSAQRALRLSQLYLTLWKAIDCAFPEQRWLESRFENRDEITKQVEELRGLEDNRLSTEQVTELRAAADRVITCLASRQSFREPEWKRQALELAAEMRDNGLMAAAEFTRVAVVSPLKDAVFMRAKRRRRKKVESSTSRTTNPIDFERLFVEHSPLIEKIVSYVSRRHRLSAGDTDEFASDVSLKLIERNYALLRRFQGRSSLSTYLTIVIERLYLDFCIRRWGKWLPSYRARQSGHTAILLEQLIERDGMTLDEAIETLRTDHRVTTSVNELRTLASTIGIGMRGRMPIPQRAGEPSADEFEDRIGALTESARIEAILRVAIRRLSSDEQLILKLRFQDELTFVAMGKVLHAPAKALHLRLKDLLESIRKEMEREGIDAASVRRLTSDPTLFEDDDVIGALRASVRGMARRVS